MPFEKLTLGDFQFIGICLEGFFYGLYCAVFFMYLHYQQAVDKTQRKTILFYSLCALYALSVSVVALDVTISAVKILPVISGASLNVTTQVFMILEVISFVTIGCCDFVSQAILIYRCWIVWNRNILIVIMPSILAFAFLATWLPGIIQSYLTQPSWGYPLTLTSLALSLTVNALVTVIIVFRIIKVYWQIKPTLGEKGGSKLRAVVFILIESGIAMFIIQLARLVVSLKPIADDARLQGCFICIQQMVNGIIPTLIQLRVLMGLSFDDEKSMVEVTSSLHFASDYPNPMSGMETVGHQEMSDNIDVQAPSNDIEIVKVER